jgi:hypothetical protein
MFRRHAPLRGRPLRDLPDGRPQVYVSTSCTSERTPTPHLGQTGFLSSSSSSVSESSESSESSSTLVSSSSSCHLHITTSCCRHTHHICDQSQPLHGNVHHCATNHNPSTGISSLVRPITTPQRESPAPCDQSQPLNGNLQHRATNHNPSKGISSTVRPITTPQ